MSLPLPLRFSTPVQVPQPPFFMDHGTRTMLIGSCFSASIHERLCADQFLSTRSPFGIVYDASAMADQLGILLSDRLFSQDDLLFDGELYHSLLHHGSHSGVDADSVVHRINADLVQARKDLEQTQILILTWASTRSFTHLPTGQRTANNHRLPGHEFRSTYESLDHLQRLYALILQAVHTTYPAINVMITISPVRYFQDGVQANTRSKATLQILAAALELQGAWVFPSYEILQDELRDYRFYHPDMIHPTSQAIDIIYDRLINALYPLESNDLLERIRKIRRSFDHRLLYPESRSAIDFINHRMEELHQLRSAYPQYTHLFDDVR